MILEDRRIRMNYWVSSIISKPVYRFKNHKINNKNNDNVKNINFTLKRLYPLSL